MKAFATEVGEASKRSGRSLLEVMASNLKR